MKFICQDQSVSSSTILPLRVESLVGHYWSKQTRIRVILSKLEFQKTQWKRTQRNSLPGYRLHQLKSNRAGTWSVTVSGNWRVTFSFEGEDAFDVNLEDYH